MFIYYFCTIFVIFYSLFYFSKVWLQSKLLLSLQWDDRWWLLSIDKYYYHLRHYWAFVVHLRGLFIFLSLSTAWNFIYVGEFVAGPPERNPKHHSGDVFDLDNDTCDNWFVHHTYWCFWYWGYWMSRCRLVQFYMHRSIMNAKNAI